MNALKKIFPNSIVITTIVVVHWLGFIFSLFNERHIIFRRVDSPKLFYERQLFYSDFHSPEPILFDWLLYLNSPAISIIEFISHPVLLLFEKNLLTEILGVVKLRKFRSLQWLFIGHLIARVVEIYKPKEVKLMLK